MKSHCQCGGSLTGPRHEPAVPVASGRNYLYAIVAGGEPRSYPSLGIEGKRRVHHYRGSRGRGGQRSGRF